MAEARRHTDEHLMAYAANDEALSPEDRAAVERHLAESPEARALVERYRAIAAARRADDSVAPPMTAMEAAKAIFARNFAGRSPSAPPNWLQTLERLVASLIFDSRAQPATAGLRGPSGAAVQLCYEADGVEVELEIAGDDRHDDRDTARSFITGQVSLMSGDEPGAITAGLTRPNDETLLVQTETDAHGAFTLSVEPGAYDLHLALANRAVSLRGIEVN